MKKQVVSIILFFITITVLLSCKSSYTHIGDKNANYIPYYLKVYKADSLFLSKNHAQSYEILDSLFKKFEPINMTLYFEYENYLKSAVILKKSKKRQIRVLVENLGYNYSNLKKDSLLNIALNSSGLNEKKINYYHKNYVKSVDTIFRKKLSDMYINDQKVRNLKPYNQNLVFKTDSIHNLVFKEYILKEGFPSDKKVGSYKKLNANDNNNFSLDLFFNHMSYGGDYEFFKEKLLSFVKNGTCPPRVYAMMIDRWNINNTANSFYYILNNTDEKWKDDKKFVKNLNNKRFEIGLPSVECHDFWYKKRILNY